MKKLIYNTLLILASIGFIPIALICALVSRFKYTDNLKPRLVWGSTPIINNSYWSRAMVKAGFSSETFTADFFSLINKRSDWDKVITEEYGWLPKRPKPFMAFLHSLFKYDVFFIPFNGYFLGNTPIKFLQAFFLKVANKKIVVIPFGADSYVYKNIRSISTIQGLLISYPIASRQQDRISKDVEYWTKHADAVIPGFMGPDGFGRWDVILPSQFFIDLDIWKSSNKLSSADGVNEEVVIAHAPNHRGFKGTEFVINAVEELKKEGFRIRLILLERLQNDRVREILNSEADILVEQLVFTGHGMNGLEGLSSCIPTISNLEDETYTLPIRRWSYFSECPLVSATPENIIDVLRKLVTRPILRHEIGIAGRKYVEKYHGLDSAQYLFTNIVEYVYGRKESLINLYHPLIGEYPNRLPKIDHPLVKNRIVD